MWREQHEMGGAVMNMGTDGETPRGCFMFLSEFRQH